MKLTNKILEAVNKGIKFALDDYEDNELQGQVNSKVNHGISTKEWLDLMNEVVDLGLPSGTLWCKYNLDVNPNLLSKQEDWYGKYYAWGELKPNKTNNIEEIYFNWNNYKFGDYNKLTKYCNNPKYGLNGAFFDNLTELQEKDDAAYLNKKLYNLKFHIPTKELCEELIKYTKNYWIKNYDPNKLIHNPEDDKGISGLNGRIFEGRNGNLLFIPAAGSSSSDNYSGLGIHNVGSLCNLWSSSLYLDVSYRAYYLYFNSDHISVYADYRCIGYSVRPVLNL